MKQATLPQSIKQLALEKIIAHCPICSADKQALQSNIVNHRNNAELLHIQCQACQGAVVALVFSSGSIVSSIGLLTDLTREEVLKFQNKSLLSEDYLIDLHHFFNQTAAPEKILQSLTH
ncbi:MAG: hypothetical protein WCW27_04145 [Patescibacteria group bacterium]|jgi:hypothetical protein